jgi:4-amino-4-deoxy-L-arabinose transferase-like glycosyltransferase
MKRALATLVLLVIGVGLIFGLVLSWLLYMWFSFTNPGKAWNVALAVDDLDNVAFNGRLGQSISSRAANANQQGKRWGCILCKYFLDVVDPGPPNHCTRALTDPKQNLELNKSNTAAAGE